MNLESSGEAQRAEELNTGMSGCTRGLHQYPSGSDVYRTSKSVIEGLK